MVGNGYKGKTGDIHGLQEIPFRGLVKRPHAFGVIGKGKGMNDAVDRPGDLAVDLIADSDDIGLLFDITKKNLAAGKEFGRCFRPLTTPDHMDDLSSGLDQHPTDTAGHRFFVG